MNRDKIKKKVLGIVERNTGEYQEVLEENLDNNMYTHIGLDSLDAIEMIMKAEEEFNISITDDEAVEVESINDMIDLVEKKLK